MSLGLICIIAAGVFYTISIWSERLVKKLMVWMVLLLGTGFICDLIGTNAMRLTAKIHVLNFHTIGGYSALVIMGLHLAWAILAIYKYKKAQELFRRYSLYAWFLWLTAWLTGVPKI